MKFVACAVVMVVIHLLHPPLFAQDPIEIAAEKPLSVVPEYVIYSPAEDAELRTSMFPVLRGEQKGKPFAKANSIAEAAHSAADVLIMIMTNPEVPKLEPKILQALRNRKIVGVGAGAAKLFGLMGLEIHLGRCAHFTDWTPLIRITGSVPLTLPNSPVAFSVLKDAPGNDASPHGNLAMFLPAGEPDELGIEAIVRWSEKPDYAPIVRQENFILIGIPASGKRWTDTYANLIREVCKSLRERKTQPFVVKIRDVTHPGTYEFNLGQAESQDQPCSETFYLQFRGTTKMTVRLEQTGSRHVVLLLKGLKVNDSIQKRLDSENSETLQISSLITAEEIEEMADRYWVVKVMNLDDENPVRCQLEVRYEEP